MFVSFVCFSVEQVKYRRAVRREGSDFFALEGNWETVGNGQSGMRAQADHKNGFTVIKIFIILTINNNDNDNHSRRLH